MTGLADRGDDARAFYLPALSRFIVGCTTGIVMAVVVKLLLLLFPAALEFSQDVGQRLFVRARAPVLMTVERRAGIDGYLFLDVDPAGSLPTDAGEGLTPSEAACRAYGRRLETARHPAVAAPAPEQLHCEEIRPLNRHLLARLVEGALARGALLVVLDARLARDGYPISAAETDDLATTLVRHADRVVFAAPLETLARAQSFGGYQLNLVRSPGPPIVPLAIERRMSAAAVSAAENELRHYPDCVGVGTNPVERLSTLPAVVAQRIRDGRVRDPVCAPGASAESPRIYYSLAARTDHLGQLGESAGSMDVYSRCPAALFWVTERPNLQPCAEAAAYADRVVVIGASSRERGDVHMTPLGRMSGAEVLINAVRSFLRHPKEQRPAASREIGSELGLVLATSTIWALAELILRWRARWRPPSQSLLGTRLGLFVVCPFVVVALSVWWSFQPDAADPRLDVLIPMLSVALEMLGEFTSWLTRTIERWLEHRWDRSQSGGVTK